MWRSMLLIDILRWALPILSIPLIVMMVIHTRRRVKQLSDRIDEYHAEQEAQKQAGPVDPYRGMSDFIGLLRPRGPRSGKGE